MTKIISLFISIIMFLFPMLNIPHADVNKESFNTEYTNVFVHGFSGWGEYDDVYKLFPYWGVRNGDLMEYLNARGFDCHAATVAPAGSAWDRACELRMPSHQRLERREKSKSFRSFLRRSNRKNVGGAYGKR